MNTFLVKYVGEDIPGQNICNFIRTKVQAFTHQEAVNKIVSEFGISPFMVVECWQLSNSQISADWGGMD